MKSLKRILYLTLLCSLFIGTLAAQTTIKIVGTVKDVKGEPMIGVQVIPVGATQKGGLTDFDGKYALDGIPSSVKAVTFSYMGYVSQTIKIKGRGQINVVLKEDNQMLDQVVVTALGIKRSQKALSYNVQELKGDILQTNKDANFVSSLSGKVAGVTINQSSAGIGSAARVVMRGAKSIEKSNSALYVIDGVPIYSTTSAQGKGRFNSGGSTESAADINPDDIESISVLTGASAAALYGSSAANGAIIITTKKGKSGAVKVNYGYNSEWGKPLRLPEFQRIYGSNNALTSWGHKLTDRCGYDVNDFFQTSNTQGHSVSISGGTDKNQTYVSLASTQAKGIVPNNAYSRYNINVRNTTSLLNDKLKLDASVTYVNQYHRNMINQGQYMNPMVAAYLMPRSETDASVRAFEKFDSEKNYYVQNWRYGMGDYNLQNPYWQAYRNLRESNRERYVLSYSASYELMKWSTADKWNISARVRYDNTAVKGTDKRFASTADLFTGTKPSSYYSETKAKDVQAYADIISTFNKGWEIWGDNRFNLNATVGASIQDSKFESTMVAGPMIKTGIPNVFDISNLSMKGGDSYLLPSGWQEQTQSIFGSLELGLNSYLYLTVTGRNDWASQLANSPQQSFFYPSVGLSGVITDMLSNDLKVKIRPVLSYLKLRASYASVASPFQRGLTSPTSTPSGSMPNGGYENPSHYPIGQLYPERTDSYEIGIASRWFNGLLTFNGSVYRTITKNQTVPGELDASSGYSKIYLQTGSVRNQGVELAVGLNLGKEDAFHYSSNFTLGYNENKILKVADSYTDPVTGEARDLTQLLKPGAGNASYKLVEGGTLGDIYVGSDFKRDVNGKIFVNEKGEVSSENFKNGELKYLGSILPKVNYGWSHEIGYKGLSIGAMLTARQGGIVVSPTVAAMDYMGVSKMTADARNVGFVEVEGQRLDPQSYFQARGKDQGLAQYYTYDATNVRLAEAHISYKIPRKLLFNKADLTLSLVGRNLGFFYIKAPFDPEAISSTGNYSQGFDNFMMPSQRTIGFSVKVGF